MSTYYNVEMSANTLIRLIEYLENYASNLNNYSEIEDVAHTIDFLEDEMERA